MSWIQPAFSLSSSFLTTKEYGCKLIWTPLVLKILALIYFFPSTHQVRDVRIAKFGSQVKACGNDAITTWQIDGKTTQASWLPFLLQGFASEVWMCASPTWPPGGDMKEGCLYLVSVLCELGNGEHAFKTQPVLIFTQQGKKLQLIYESILPKWQGSLLIKEETSSCQSSVQHAPVIEGKCFL